MDPKTRLPGNLLTMSMNPDMAEDEEKNRQEMQNSASSTDYIKEYLKPFIDAKMNKEANPEKPAPSEGSEQYGPAEPTILDKLSNFSKQQFDKQQESKNDYSKIMNDRMKMRFTPDIQGPPQPSYFEGMLPAEADVAQQNMAFGNSAGSLVNKGASFGGLSKFANNAAKEKYLQSLEDLPGKFTDPNSIKGKMEAAAKTSGYNQPRTYNKEKMAGLEELVQKIQQDPTIDPDKKKQTLARFQDFINEAKKRGIEE